jgi:hypothetical protein
MPQDDQDSNDGIELTPVSEVRLVARDEAQKAIVQHLGLCPFARDDVNRRLRGMEITLARLIGFMFGAGLLGGAAGGTLQHLLSHPN